MVERIGHYRIVRELGQGAMGVVYLAHEESLNRTVALKVLAPQLIEDEEILQRFQLEARSLAQLNHRNIVQIYLVGEDDGQHFFAMEHVPSSLEQLLRDQGALDSSRAAQLVLNAASGLAAAHERGIVHRHVKPGNLLIAENGTLKVADFGIARMAAASTRLTADGASLGTPSYMAPEQCAGEDGDHRSDIYALGVTYYQMLSGKLPFQSTNPYALVKEKLLETPAPIEEVVPGVDERTRAIVGRMMAKEPGDRYQSAGELAADLQAHLLSHVLPDWDGRSSLRPPAAAPPPPPAPVAATRRLPRPQISPLTPQGAPAPAVVELEVNPREAGVNARHAPFPRWTVAALAVLAVLAVAGISGVAVAWMIGRGGPPSGPEADTAQGLPPGDLLDEGVPSDAGPESGNPLDEGAPSGAGPESGNPLDEGAGFDAGPEAQPAGGARRPVGGQVDGGAQAAAGASDPGESKAADKAPLPVPRPDPGPPADTGEAVTEPRPPRGVAVVVSGDDPLIAGAVEDYLARHLASEVELVAEPSLVEVGPGEPPPSWSAWLDSRGERAQHVVMAHTVYLGERPLYYLGRRDVAYQSRVTLKCYEPAGDQNPVHRWAGTVEYTAVETGRAVGKALRQPTAELIAALRR